MSSPIDNDINDNSIKSAEGKVGPFARLTNKRWKKVIITIIAVLITIVLAAVATFSVMYHVGRNKLLSANTVSMTTPDNSEIDVDMDEDGTVIYNGTKYVFNENVTAILVMGVDKISESDYITGFKGQADALFLVVIDTETGKTTVVAIPRDIMAEVPVSTKDGRYVGIETHQICTAYAYGDGEHVSCENMVTAVSRLMYGVPINTYFSMDWSAVGVLNDMIGGVTVPEYDSQWRPTGNTVTLRGQKALDYIRQRDKNSVDANDNRVDRQINYLKSFANGTIQKMKTDLTLPLKMFNTLNKYSTNNIDASRITYLSTVFMSGGADLTFDKVKGEYTMGEKYAELYVNEQELYALAIRLFYVEKNK